MDLEKKKKKVLNKIIKKSEKKAKPEEDDDEDEEYDDKPEGLKGFMKVKKIMHEAKESDAKEAKEEAK